MTLDYKKLLILRVRVLTDNGDFSAHQIHRFVGTLKMLFGHGDGSLVELMPSMYVCSLISGNALSGLSATATVSL